MNAPGIEPSSAPDPGEGGDGPPVRVRLLPALIRDGDLDGAVAVVVDVLRATTSMVHALDAGAERIVPCAEIDEARALASGLPSGTALLAGERLGGRIAGFDLGNSPGAFTPESCGGKTIVMTTTNGTRAILASLGAARVLIASFPNLGATTRALSRDGRPVVVVCSGTDGLVSLEDTYLAGALVDGIGTPDDDAARLAAALYRSANAGGGPLPALLAEGRGGRRVSGLGLGLDIEAAGRVDAIDLVAEVQRDPTRVVRTG